MSTPQQQVIDKCKQVFEVAKRLYGVDMSKVGIRFDLKGRVGGMACRRGGMYYMRFNYDMLQRETEEMVNVVAPHEIAHIICYMKPMLGSNHDTGWQRVCKALGGSGERTHDMDVVYGKGLTYEYITDRGHKVRLNDRRHDYVQAGRSLMYRKGMGSVTKQCAYSIVGRQGHTLAQPVVRNAVATKEVPVSTIIPKYVPTFSIGAPAVKPATGVTKESIVRNIMIEGKASGATYEQMINAIMLANNATRERAKSTYSFCAKKFNIVM